MRPGGARAPCVSLVLGVLLGSGVLLRIVPGGEHLTNAGSSSTLRAAHCGRTWPIAGNATLDPVAGYTPRNCIAAAYSLPLEPLPRTFPALARCLANRSVYIWGNSVSRGFAFELEAMLDNSARASREEQKARCDKLPGSDRDLCEIAAGFSTKILYEWILFMDARPFQPAPAVAPVPELDAFASGSSLAEDKCGEQTPRECFSAIFEGASERDIFICNLGYVYAIMDPHSIRASKMTAWLEAHIRDFIALVNEIFPGRIIYMNVAPAEITSASAAWNDVRIRLWNDLVLRIVLKETDWLVFDLWSVVSDFVGSSLFEDRIHFPGRLTQIGWGFLEHMLCPP